MWAAGIGAAVTVTAALAGGWYEAVDKDVSVAMHKANIGALDFARSHDTCIGRAHGFAKEAECRASQDGTQWVCRAEYSTKRGSCPKRRGATVLEQWNSQFDALKSLCSEGRESACAAAVGAGG
jgi:hypothetical protein